MKKLSADSFFSAHFYGKIEKIKSKLAFYVKRSVEDFKEIYFPKKRRNYG
jgi:hypothetical protein